MEGEGPLVVLQHGLLMDGGAWKQAGFVGALSERYRVVCVDSLGHGLSDKPSEPASYHQEPRSGDIIAVIDDLDVSAPIWSDTRWERGSASASQNIIRSGWLRWCSAAGTSSTASRRPARGRSSLTPS